MSDELNEIVDNITKPSVWTRMLLMTIFAVASYFVLLPLILVLSIAQALFTLITGKGNANIRYFSSALELYTSQLFKFMTYLSEVRPFPFSDLPQVEDDSLQEKSAPKKTDVAAKDEVKVSAASAVVAKPAVKKKVATKKAAAKKAAKKKAPKKEPKTIEKPEKDASSDGVSDS
ncbi:MAG: hypothetical protein ACI80L_000587 [Pseudohongiellaceae bacterium]|jgi:hypothetical protein